MNYSVFKDAYEFYSENNQDDFMSYIITRFSIFDENRGVSNIKLNKNILFSDKRLSEKFNLFENHTLPSILNQTNSNWIWHIYTSSYLPEKWKNKLINLTKDSRIKLFYCNNFNDFFEKILRFNYGNKYATIRLDDDDELSNNYIELLQQYKNESKKIVTFSNGHRNQNNKLRKWYKPKIALGISAIDFNIYLAGKHGSVDQNYTVIEDKTPNMWIRNEGDWNDSSQK
tara:strand:+ start:1535 stop:2218 length:684 start_codon:yes stop_codon:yes gene_type:complete